MKTSLAKWLAPFGAVLGLVVVPSQLQATVIAPGGFVTPVPVPAPALGVSMVLADTGTQAWAGNGFAGMYRDVAVMETPGSNPEGGLTFILQVKLTTTPDGGIRVPPIGGTITRITNASFAGWITDVSTLSAPASGLPTNGGLFAVGNTQPISADRSAGTGAVIGFNYITDMLHRDGAGGIGAGGVSWIMIIRTNAPGFTSGTLSFATSSSDFGTRTDGGIDVPAFAPSPEPGSLVLLASCFLGLGSAYAWRRRHRAPTSG